MKQILDNFLALGRKRLAILGVTALVIIGALVFGLSAVLAPTWRPIATNITAAEGASMVSALEQAGFKPRLSQDGSVVTLPEDELARARMALAEAGVAPEGLPGWELFDNQSGIGMNTFLQRVNRLRALEGELARSIQTIDVVETARIHLVLPEREAFSAERPEPSAAIIIRTRRGIELERKQALAIRSLVAAALPGLSASRVAVMSASGETILAEETDVSGANSTQNARIAVEDRIARNIEQILSARVGAGNVRVRVAADLATAREVTLRETFDPDSRVARQTRSTTDNSNRSENSGDTTDVLNNIPGGLNADGGQGSQEARQRSEDESNFEIGSTRVETVLEPGSVKRLSVAVLVNGTMIDGGYQDRSPEELTRLAALVRSTMGYDESRGDTVTVDSLQFVEGDGLPMASEPATLAENLLGHIPSLVRWIVALLIVAIIVFFAVRPALARLSGKEGAITAKNGAAGEAGVEEAEGEAVDGEEGATDPATAEKAAPKEGEDDAEYVSLVSVRGNVTKRHLQELGELVERENDASLRQIRQWLKQKS